MKSNSRFQRSTIDYLKDEKKRQSIANNESLNKLSKQKATEAEKLIVDALINQFGYTKKDAERIALSVFSSTKAILFTKYQPELSVLNETGNDRADLAVFLDTVLYIPMYQSLGDTLGYNGGDWEFNYGKYLANPEYVNELIYEFITLGGVNDISLTNWIASDDTILYIETYKVLNSEKSLTVNEFGRKLRLAYIGAKKLLENRHPGATTMSSIDIQENIEWDKLPYNSKSIGAGSAMRSGSIGITYAGGINREVLIRFSVECSRITHNSAVAILGSITSALFTAYAIEKVPLNKWVHKLLKLMRSDVIDEYMKTSRPNEYHLYQRDKVLYIGQWEKYINFRFSGINPRLDLKWMKNPVLRFKYMAEKFSKGCEIPGSCADDCLIMAYDALLESGGVIEKLIIYSILHPGDSDTVGVIAFSWFGSYYQSNRNMRLIGERFLELEFYDELLKLQIKNLPTMTAKYYWGIYLSEMLHQLNKALKIKLNI